MSERQEEYKTGKVAAPEDVTAIKTLCLSIEPANQNGALFFLAQELLKAGAVPTSSKGLAHALHQAAQRLSQEVEK